MKIAMIPARMGSQRLKKKNLRKICGMPLITLAIRKCVSSGTFDEIWVNSEHTDFAEIASQEGIKFHKRPPELASNTATSEDFVYEFLKAHPCDHLFQIHSIAPLMTSDHIANFTKAMIENNYDVMLSAVNEQIECAIEGRPINFSFNSKTNSQELIPVQRITWSMTGWKCKTYIDAYESGKCATYAGHIGFFSIDRLAGHIIKTEEDLIIAEALLMLRNSSSIE